MYSIDATKRTFPIRMLYFLDCDCLKIAKNTFWHLQTYWKSCCVTMVLQKGSFFFNFLIFHIFKPKHIKWIRNFGNSFFGIAIRAATFDITYMLLYAIFFADNDAVILFYWNESVKKTISLCIVLIEKTESWAFALSMMCFFFQ